jgi:hypothetical protein
MSLIHGSMGIIYFVHQFRPAFIEAGLLADQEMSEAVKAINQQILALAPVLNSPTLVEAATATSSDQAVPIDIMVKQHDGVVYLFAVGMRNAPARGTFRVEGLPSDAVATVLGESREIPVRDRRFEDDFRPYDVHLYRIAPASAGRGAEATALPKPVKTQAVSQLLTQVDQRALSRNVFYLAKDPLPYRKANYTRPGQAKSTLTETDEFVSSKLESWGYQVEKEALQVQAFRCDRSKPKQHWYSPPQPSDPWYTAYNLYAKKIGTARPDEIICIISHKDSPSWIDSPGAHDNAVGTAGNLELARVLAAYPTKRTVWFLFCNEEHYPWTSIAAAERAKARGDNLVAILNLDALAGKPQQDREAGRRTNVTLYTAPEGEALAQLMAEVNESYDIGLVQSSYKREYPGDDDGSFIKAGFPAAVANIGSYPYADPNYHSEGDVPELVDLVNLRMTVQATLAALLTLDQR